MGRPLRILIVEDSEDDTRLLLRELRRGGFETAWQRVETADGMNAALAREKWDLIVADYTMPQFTGLGALNLMRDRNLDLPFIIVSGRIGEDVAVEAMRAGAHDYVLKDNLTRLNAAIERELCEAEIRQEHKHLEVRLRQQQKLEEIGTLAGGVAHEINNPINGIMNYAQLISDRLDPESPLREFAVGIGREAERVAKIVRNLLAFARQEKESHSLASIAEIVSNTLSLIRTIIRGDQITLEVDVPSGLPNIKCRSQQIQQVLMNLLTNARDALNQRYPEHDPDKIMMVTVRPFEKEGRPWIRVMVEDHGVGIPDEIRGRLFDPFFTTKDRTQGTGLGLSISHGIVQEHRGELCVESEPGEYTRFLLELQVDNEWKL